MHTDRQGVSVHKKILPNATMHYEHGVPRAVNIKSNPQLSEVIKMAVKFDHRFSLASINRLS